MSEPERIDVDFHSEGTRCAAWLYRPAGIGRAPVVVMAHGFGAVRGMLLDRYAERFAAAGMAAFVFDYRYFGDSDGTPRQLVNPQRQLADWCAALRCVRARDDIDAARVALWGTSFSGGHVVVTAARDGNVAAVAAQVPFLDARATPRPPVAVLLKTLGATAADCLRALAGRPPRTIPIIGEPGETAALTFEGWKEAYLSLTAAYPGIVERWQNAIPARSIPAIIRYNPAPYATRVRCPALVIAARHDEGLPLPAAEAVVKAMPRGRLEVFDCRHFDVYTGEFFERAVALQTEFLTEQLRTRNS